MFMLVYPFTFYAVYGFVKLLRKSSFQGKIRFSSLASNKKATGMILLTLCLGVAYLATPVTMAYANKSVPNITRTQVYFSTDPAVPYQDVDSVVQAMGWLNNNLDAASCVILQNHFLNWGKLYLDNVHTIVTYESNLDSAVNKTIACGFSRVFFVWWNQPIGWNDVSVPQSFVRVQDFGRISVYAMSV
jgi:hypothetical protein